MAKTTGALLSYTYHWFSTELITHVSPNTDRLAWVIERATGRRYADLMSELIWNHWEPSGAPTSPSTGSAGRAVREVSVPPCGIWPASAK